MIRTQLRLAIGSLLLASCSAQGVNSAAYIRVHRLTEKSKPATEYLVPCKAMPVDVRESLHPWLREMVGSSSDEVRAVVAERWSKISHECLVGLKHRLLEYRPRGIIVYEGEGWLVMERPLPRNLPAGHPTDIILLAPPADRDSITRGLNKAGFADTPLFREFVENFGNLRETIPNCAGDFRVPRECETLYDYWGENDVGYGEWYADWSGSLVLYGSTTGDMLLLHPDGQIAWVYLAKGVPLELVSDNFEGFIRQYTDYRRQPGPLEAYR